MRACTLRWSQGPSQVQGGEGGRKGALRLRWARRLRESLALFARVMVGGRGDRNSRGKRIARDKEGARAVAPHGRGGPGWGQGPHERWHQREAARAARGRHARTASGAHARARTLRAVPQIAVCGCGPQPACRPGRSTPRSNASKSGSARGQRQDPTFVCESGGRQPACPLGLSLAGQESVRRRTRAREQCCRSAETVPRGAGNRLDASRARPPCDEWRPAAAPHAGSVAHASHTDTSDSRPPPVGCRAPPTLRNRGPETDPRVGGLPQDHKSEYREACHCHRATA